MIANLKPYAAYKDSGVPWLGKVPEHWEVKRLASCLRSLESGSREQIGMDAENGIPNLGGEHIGRDGQLLLRNMRYISRRYFQSLRKGLVKENDVLLVKDGATIGKVAIVRVMPYPECTVNEHVFILRSAKDCLSGFIYHSMSSQGLQELIWQLVTGSAQPGLNSTFIKGVHLSLPPLPEQTAIVRFLNYMDRRIRRSIRAKQKLITLLEEYRQALIHQAVTGKIDVRTGKPYPAYKDSGVPWLGQVPEHWEVKPVKRRYAIQLGKMLQTRPNNPDDVEVPYLKAQHIQWFSVRTSDASKMWASPRDIQQFRIAPGDLLVCEGGEGGRCGIVKEIPDGFIIQNALHRVRPLDNCRNDYLQYAMSAIATTGWFDALNNKATIAHFTREKFGALYIPIPSPDEQTAIVEYLDAQTAKLDTAIGAARREIELLREYRERLIADVVTGKVDVREVAAQLPEEPPEEEAGTEEEEPVAEELATADSQEEANGEE